MPELPEVETTRRGIAPHLVGQRVARVVVREHRLRWPIPEDLDVRLSGQRIECVERRAKYLLIKAESGSLIGHLGMSGSLRLVECGLPAAKHEHVDIELESGLTGQVKMINTFGVAYGSDKEVVRTAALEAAESVPEELVYHAVRKPQVWFVEFGESSGLWAPREAVMTVSR